MGRAFNTIDSELAKTYLDKEFTLELEGEVFEGKIYRINENGVEIKWYTVAPDGKLGGICVYNNVKATLDMLNFK